MSKVLKIQYGIGKTDLDSCLKLAKYLNLPGELYIKREDKNPTGSYKDRSISIWISRILQKNIQTRFVISSSGNAAIAAAAVCIISGRPLSIYISTDVETKKFWRLKKIIDGDYKVGKWQFKKLAVNLQKYEFEDIKDSPKIVKQTEIDSVFKELSSNIEIIKTDKPKKEAMLAGKKKDVIVLRGSIDDQASIGYEEIAKELFEQTNGKISDIFLPSSSGVGAIGIYNGFKHLLAIKKITDIPRFYICQTVHCHALTANIAKKKSLKIEDKTITPAICDRIAFQRKKIEEIINETKGAGLIMNNKEIRNGSYLLNKYGQVSGIEGALALSGVIKAVKNKLKLGRSIVSVNTGI